MNGVSHASMLMVLSFNRFIKDLSIRKTEIEIANHADNNTPCKSIYL